MSVVFLVVLIVIGVLLLLAIIGAAMASRRNALGAIAFEQSLAAVDRQLASAVAADRGWERGTLEASARSAFAEQRPQTKVAELELVQVVDEPGTDQDLAVFLVVAADGAESRLTLGRRGGAWYATSLEDKR
jgi:type II secretory pathway pseudopilin PulG